MGGGRNKERKVLTIRQLVRSRRNHGALRGGKSLNVEFFLRLLQLELLSTQVPQT